MGSAELCDGDTYRPLAGVRHGQDYLEIRVRHLTTTEWPDPPAQEFETIAAIGERCQGANDLTACEAAVASASAERGFEAESGWLPPDLGNAAPQRPTAHYLVATKGDEVRTLTTAAELKQLLAPIEDAKSAALIATLHNHEIECRSEPLSTAARRADGSWELSTLSGGGCAARVRYDLRVDAQGEFAVEGSEVLESGNPACGRKPNGLRSVAACGVELGAYLAEAAHLEAASVIAFAQIERELRGFGAPEELLSAARVAIADEERHAAAVTRLATRFGAAVPAAEVAEVSMRSLFAFALDNAVEGCVRETFGALLAEAQAQAATDAEIAAVMRDIAREEAEHAALSWQIAAWAEPQLTPQQQAAIALAKHEALHELERGLSREYAAEVHQLAGMPSPRLARALLAQLRPSLVQAAALAA